MGDVAALVPYRASTWPALDPSDWAEMFQFGNMPLRLNTTLSQNEEQIGTDFAGLVLGAYETNPVIFSLELKRLALFTQARFKFRSLANKELFGTPDLRILERPAIGETTQDLLYRVLISADYGGDAFIVERPGNRLVVPRPDWCTMVLGSRQTPRDGEDPTDLDMELIALLYHEDGRFSSKTPVLIQRNQFAHYAPIRDPLARFRGMPWPLAALNEIRADKAATVHKLKFFENGATPNMVVTLDPSIKLDDAREWIELFEQDHKGVLNAYKTIYFGGGATSSVVGANLRQLDFKATQGAGETRMAAASGIHPTIAGLSEGLQGSSLNAGNFRSAAQLTGDTFLRPQWANLAGSLEVIVKPPADSELWYDESDVAFLKEDVKDAADVLTKQATAIRTLTDGGYVPDTVVAGVTAGNLKGIRHAGYLPVQVQPIQGNGEATPPTAAYPYEVRCTGTRKDGTPCGALVARRASATPVGFEAKCDRCGTLVAA